MNIVKFDMSQFCIERLYCPFTGALVLSLDTEKNRFVMPHDGASPFLLWRYARCRRQLCFTAEGEKLARGVKLDGIEISDESLIDARPEGNLFSRESLIAEQHGVVLLELAEMGCIDTQAKYEKWLKGREDCFYEDRTYREMLGAADKRAAFRKPLFAMLKPIPTLVVYEFTDMREGEQSKEYPYSRSYLTFRAPHTDEDAAILETLPDFSAVTAG